jgi:thioredoxin reductase (NADPH)
MSKIHEVLIIGSGPAGLTAAIYAARAELNPIVFEGMNPGGQLISTSLVENWPGNISILGAALINNIQKHAQHFGAKTINENIVAVDFNAHPFTLTSNKDTTYKTKSVIIATGAGPRKLGCPGETAYWGKGVTTCAICDGALFKDMPVVIIGGGDTAMEDALFMTKFTKKITVIHILDKLTASPVMQTRVLENPNISVIFNNTISEIKGNGEHVTSVIIKNQQTNKETSIPARALFLAIGLKPNTEFLKGSLKLDAYGYIETFCPTTTTSVEGVFACGDAADYIYKQAITSSGTGCMAALDAQRYLSKIP